MASVFVSITALEIAFSILGVYREVTNLLFMVWRTLSLTNMNVFMFIVYGFVIIAYYISFFMFMFALLNLIYKGERNILIGILLYFGLSFLISSIVNMLSLSVGGLLLGMGNFGNIGFYWYIILIYAILGAGMLALTYHFMNKKMELQ